MQTERDFRSELDALDEGPTDAPAAPQSWTPSTPLAREIVQSPIIDQIDIRKQVEDEEKRETARRGSSPLWRAFEAVLPVASPAIAGARRLLKENESEDGSLLGTLGALDEAGQKEWIVNEKAAADRSLAFWDSLRKDYGAAIKQHARNVIDYSPQGFLVGKVVGGDESLGDQFGGWLDRKVAENITTARRRRILAEQMENGERAGPKFAGWRATVDDFNRGVANVGTSAIKGVAYGLETGDLYNANPIIGTIIKGMDAVGYGPARSGISKAQERNLYKFAAFIDTESKRLFPEDEARQEEFRKQLAEGAGSMIAFMGAGYAAMRLGAGPVVATMASGLLGGLSQSGTMTDDALKKYRAKAGFEDRALTPEEEREATQVWLLGLGIGATEALPLAKFFSGGHSGRFIRGVLMQATEEGSQEWVQAVLENVVAQRYYDPERQWDDNAWDGAAVGFLLGAKTEAGRAGIAKIKGKKPEEPVTAAEPAAPPMSIPDAPAGPDVMPMLDGEDRGKGPRSRTTKPIDPDLDKFRQQIEAIVPPAPETGPASARRVLGKGLEELISEGGPGDAVSKVAGVVSTKLETGKVPTFAELLGALPKDERGDPDMGRLADELEKVGVRAWNGLSDDQRRQIYEAVSPVVQAVEADPRGAIEAVGDAVRTVVEAAGQPASVPQQSEPSLSAAKRAEIDALADKVVRERGAYRALLHAQAAEVDATTPSRRAEMTYYQQSLRRYDTETNQLKTAQPTPAADLRTAFDRVLSSRTKRADWAKTIGASKEQLDALVSEALSDGRLKKTKAGGIARTGKKVALPARVEEPVAPLVARPEPPVVSSAPATMPLNTINVEIDVEVADDGSAAKVTLRADEAIRMVDRRIKSLQLLKECLAS